MSYTVASSVVNVAFPVTINVLACLPTPFSALAFIIILFTVASVVTFWSFLSLYCHPHRRPLPQFSSYTTTFHRFCIAISPRCPFSPRLSHIFTFSIIIATVVDNINTVCTSCHYHYCRERSLHYMCGKNKMY